MCNNPSHKIEDCRMTRSRGGVFFFPKLNAPAVFSTSACESRHLDEKKSYWFFVVFRGRCFLSVTHTLLLLAKSSDRLWKAEKVCVENNSRVLRAVYIHIIYITILYP